MSLRLERSLFMLAVLWGASIVWMAPHPPMVDLPQHAGQVALLRDMLLGVSPWSNLFHINPLTPYLIGYGLALPLSFIMPISAVLKLMLSLAYIAFVGMCVVLRRRFNADPRLDWLFLVPFFGFAFSWGFFTFLIAVPVGLFFLYLADLYAVEPRPKLAIGLFFTGAALLMSHGLVFLFGLAVGPALYLARHGRLVSWKHLLPYGMLLLICGLYYLVNQRVNTGMHMQWMGEFNLSLSPTRIFKTVIYSAGPHLKDGYIYPKMAAIVLLMAVPWLLGLRITWRDKARWTPFLAVLLVLLLMPDFAWGTAFLYQRFAIFFLPAYAWMFTAGSRTSRHTQPALLPALLHSRPAARWATPLAFGASMLILGIHTLTFLQFGKETRDFDELLSEVEPNQRALALVLDQNSQAVRIDRMYAHYPVWYQAEDHGLVDYNFAWLPPQVVRYRPEKLPPIPPGFDWHPEAFDWTNNQGNHYTYFFVRHTAGIPASLFASAQCRPYVVRSAGTWTVFKRANCGQGLRASR